MNAALTRLTRKGSAKADVPLFSVIVPSYNRINQLRGAIDSVLAQTFADYELIVVDDGSTDDTSALKEIYTGINFIFQNNLGVSAARNAGIRAGDSKYIAFLDSDDIWLPAKLEKQLAFIESRVDIKISQTNEIWVRNGRRVNPRRRHIKRGGHIFIESLALCLVSPSAAVIERDIIEKYGLFDERLPACEDYDLWLRVLSHEEAGLLDENLVIRYAGHSGQLSEKYWGMDSFRLYSIIKLLRDDKGLQAEYAHAAKQSAAQRGALLIAGAQKRNNQRFAEKLKEILILLSHEDYSSIDCQILLEK
ncbi:MAG: glycosyltransferase [Spirochaetia bacterium]|nr:glycosyltransferase [Spirochaetia bacterium]